MSILTKQTERRAIQIIARSLKISETMPSDVRLTKIDNFELSFAKNMLKSVIENNEQVIVIKPAKKP
jgi:hypothetical protein